MIIILFVSHFQALKLKRKLCVFVCGLIQQEKRVSLKTKQFERTKKKNINKTTITKKQQLDEPSFLGQNPYKQCLSKTYDYSLCDWMILFHFGSVFFLP